MPQPRGREPLVVEDNFFKLSSLFVFRKTIVMWISFMHLLKLPCSAVPFRAVLWLFSSQPPHQNLFWKIKPVLDYNAMQYENMFLAFPGKELKSHNLLIASDTDTDSVCTLV